MGPQRGVDYYYKHIHREPKKEEDFQDSYRPANKDVQLNKLLSPVQKRRYGDYIPISQIVKPRREERVALHMKKILQDEE